MRVLATGIILSTLLSGCANTLLTSAANGGPDQVVPRIAAQFSTCNIDDLLTNYLPDVEFVSPGTPRPLLGTAAIKGYFQEACPGNSLPVMQVEVQRVRLLAREAAVVTGTYSFGRSDKPSEKPWPAFFVITLKQLDGTWKISSQATFPIPDE
jgi:uncharacterized protein (TIGR02246 family)